MFEGMLFKLWLPSFAAKKQLLQLLMNREATSSTTAEQTWLLSSFRFYVCFHVKKIQYKVNEELIITILETKIVHALREAPMSVVFIIVTA